MTANLTTDPNLRTVHTLVETAFKVIHASAAAIATTTAGSVEALFAEYVQTAPLRTDYADEDQYQQAMADWADVHDRLVAHLERLQIMANAYALAVNDVSLPGLADDTNEGAASVLEEFGHTLANYATYAELNAHPEDEYMADDYDWEADLGTDYDEETQGIPAV